MIHVAVVNALQIKVKSYKVLCRRLVCRLDIRNDTYRDELGSENTKAMEQYEKT